MNLTEPTAYQTPSRKGFVTNYPEFRHWKKLALTELVTPRPLVLYVHIPFCAQRCAYCYYLTIQESRKSEIERYVNALCREIELAAAQFQLHGRPVMSLYFGGGTPTLLNESQFTRMMECLHKHFTLANPEFTVEAEPVTLTEKKAALLQKLAVNRISLGIQSLCDDILKSANRQDTEPKALKAIKLAKATGAVVNIDLLSGLAGETPATWAYTLEKAIAADVHSITVYKMELYANSDYYKEVRHQTIALPTDDQELDFMRFALAQFEQANYLPWSFFTFTQAGRYPHLYASSIWRGVDCYAFGVSAFGELGHWLYQNTNELEKYFAALDAGELPINRGYELRSLDRIIRTVLLGMKLIRLDLQEFQQQFGFRLEALCAEALAYLTAEAFVTVTEQALALTPKGILYGEYVGKILANDLKKSY